MTEVVRATGRFLFLLWVPEMRTRKGDLASWLPRPNPPEGEIGRGSTGAEPAGVSDTLQLGLGSRGTQRTRLLRQGNASGRPLGRGFAGFKTSPGERRGTSLTAASRPRGREACRLSFLPLHSLLPAPSRQSCLNCHTPISPKKTKTNTPFKKEQFYTLGTVFKTLQILSCFCPNNHPIG